MKIATVGLIALLCAATFGLAAPAKAQSVDKDGCWPADNATCLTVSADWGTWEEYEDWGKVFETYITNRCRLRVFVRVCHESAAPADNQCIYLWVEPGDFEYTITPPTYKPTGRYAWSWTGSTTVGHDTVCANKAGLTEWVPNYGN